MKKENKSIAFVKSEKENENRIAILPVHLSNLKDPTNVYIEEGYGLHLGIQDVEYEKNGANICSNREKLLSMDIIVDPKIGDATYINKISKNSILFGYFHAVQNKKLTDQLVALEATCFAWEDMFEGSMHVFNYNNRLAGFASVMHASTLWGRLIKNKKVAVIGRGNTAIGAIEALSKLGAIIDVLTRNNERDLKNMLHEYDVIVNAVLWDITRKDYIISRKDLGRMKKNSMIIDISCDIDGAIESSEPRGLNQPIVLIEDIYHYSLSNSPTLFAYDASFHFSEKISKFLDSLCSETTNQCLKDSIIIKDGLIIDDRINIYQKR